MLFRKPNYYTDDAFTIYKYNANEFMEYIRVHRAMHNSELVYRIEDWLSLNAGRKNRELNDVIMDYLLGGDYFHALRILTRYISSNISPHIYSDVMKMLLKHGNYKDMVELIYRGKNTGEYANINHTIVISILPHLTIHETCILWCIVESRRRDIIEYCISAHYDLEEFGNTVNNLMHTNYIQSTSDLFNYSGINDNSHMRLGIMI